MKGTTFGCLNLFQMTACLENDYSARGCSEQTRWRRVVPTTDLVNVFFIFRPDLQAPDRDLLAATGTFPYIGDGTEGDWTVTHPVDLVGYDV